LRLPTVGEGLYLVRQFNLANLPNGGSFWTDETDGTASEANNPDYAYVVSDYSYGGGFTRLFQGLTNVVCVTTPTS
jgi:hypothetical protein